MQGRRRRRIGNGICRAELNADAPLAAAIGACMLSSLVLPVSAGSGDEEDGTAVDSTDARFAVMGIVSFIPYFNWLSWVFAWLDTGKRRYGQIYLCHLKRVGCQLLVYFSALCMFSWRQASEMETFRAFNYSTRLQSFSPRYLERKMVIGGPLRAKEST